MQNLKQQASQSLLEQGFITEEQLIEIKATGQELFFLHNELKLFLYLVFYNRNRNPDLSKY
jgi:hypothetical protein